MAARSEVVLEGTITDRWSETTDLLRGVPTSRFVLDVTVSYKGGVDGDRVVFSLAGGTLDNGEEVVVDSMPVLAVGDYLLLCGKLRRDGTLRPTNVAQAVLRRGQDTFGEPIAIDGQDGALVTLEPDELPTTVTATAAAGGEPAVDADHVWDEEGNLEEPTPLAEPYTLLSWDEAVALVAAAVAETGAEGVPGILVAGFEE